MKIDSRRRRQIQDWLFIYILFVASIMVTVALIGDAF
jgi:hypothetical protein